MSSGERGLAHKSHSTRSVRVVLGWGSQSQEQSMLLHAGIEPRSVPFPALLGLLK